MKNLLLITFCVAVLFSCNDGKNQAALLQHKNDSLRVVMQQQKQQKQIDSLTTSVNSMKEHHEQNVENGEKTHRKQMLSFWQQQSQSINAKLYADRANLNNVQQYHIGRLESTKKREIAQASEQLENDGIRAQQIADSVRAYQN